MLLKNLNIEICENRPSTDEEPYKSITLESEVIITRKGATYSVPFIKKLEVDLVKYKADDLETFITIYLFEAKKITEKWIVQKTNVEEDGHRKFITERPFDITKDI